jgi:hypothetical protein
MEPQFPMTALQDDEIKQLAKRNMKSSQLQHLTRQIASLARVKYSDKLFNETMFNVVSNFKF